MGKEDRRPHLPDIPGLSRGADSIKGRIERQGILWAADRRAAFPDIRVDIAVIATQKKDFLELPILGIDDQKDIPLVPSWAPRVHPVTGAVYTSRWQGLKGPLDPEKYIAFAGKKHYPELSVDSLPKGWRVAQLIPQMVEGGLEAAMRQQDELHHDVSKIGVEQARVAQTLANIFLTTEIFLRGRVTEKDLKSLAEETEIILKQEGLLQAKDVIWEKVVDYTLRAAQQDKIGRVNPQRSRILTRAAFLKVVDKELVLRATQEKTNKAYAYLSLIRAQTRNRIGTAAKMIDEIGGFGKEEGLEVFSSGRRWVKAREAWNISQSVKAVSEMLAPIQAAPYFVPARLAEAILIGTIGKSNKDELMLTEILAAAGPTASSQLERESVEGYLRSLDAVSARKRLKHAYGVLRAVLEDADHENTRVFNR